MSSSTKEHLQTVTVGAPMDAGAVTAKAPLTVVNVLRGILFGALVAALSAAIWFGIDVLLHTLIGDRETVSVKVLLIPFVLAALLGFSTAQSVIKGMRQGGLIAAIISPALLLVALFISDYLLDRHYTLQAMAESGVKTTSVPLFMPLDEMIDFVRLGLESSPIYAVYYIIALLTALITPLTPGGRQARR